MATKQKICLKSNVEDEKSKRRIMKCLAGIEGVESIAVDTKEGNITVIGDTDPALVLSKLRKLTSVQLVSVGPAKPENFEAKKAEKRAEAVGGFGGMNRAIEDNEGSETRIVEAVVEAVAGFGDFSSIQVDIKKGMVTVVGKSVPVRVALKVREMGYRAKLLSLGPATEEEDPDEEDNEDLYHNYPSTTRDERYPTGIVTGKGYPYTVLKDVLSTTPCTIA